MAQSTILPPNMGYDYFNTTHTLSNFKLQRNAELFHAVQKKHQLNASRVEAFIQPTAILSDLQEALPQTVQPSPTSDNQQQISTPSSIDLLQLPADILYEIADHLDVASSYSLALTCRSFWHAALPQTRHKLQGEDKARVLLSIENDRIADGFFFCHRCTKLHKFEKTWGPHSKEEALEKGEVHQCGSRDRFSPTGNAYELAHHHVRLAMKAHRYGEDQGIPLQNLCIEHTQQRKATTINCKTNATVFKDELLLKRVYNFTVKNDDASAFRSSTGFRDFRICEHTPFFRQSSIYHQNLPELLHKPEADDSGSSTDDEFVACAKRPGSCGICLMDYDISIKKVDDGNAWSVTINAYHSLGDGRSPDDWKWARFTEKTRPHLFLPSRPNRRASGYASGAVKRSWLQARCLNGITSSALR